MKITTWLNMEAMVWFASTFDRKRWNRIIIQDVKMVESMKILMENISIEKKTEIKQKTKNNSNSEKYGIKITWNVNYHLCLSALKC